MPRPEKEEKVRGIAERLSAANGAVIADYRGLTVKDAAQLRAALAEVDTRFSVVKNTLTRLAVKQAGFDGLTEFVDGPTAIAFIHGDLVVGAKRLVDEARRLPFLDVRGGVAEGRILSPDQIRELAALESREVMLARVAGLSKAQLSRTAFALQALQLRLVRLMEALKEKLPEEPATESSGETEPPPAESPATTEEPAPETRDPSEMEIEPPAEGSAESPAEEATEGGGA